MDQARLEKYAGWLVQNKDKKGTPEFDTVAKAYKTLRAQGTSDTPKTPSWSEVPGQALQNAPASIGNLVKDTVNAVVHPIETAKTLNDTFQGGIENIPGVSAINDWAEGVGLAKPRDKKRLAEQQRVASDVGQNYKDRYGGVDNIKRTLANDPAGVVADVAGIATGGELAASRVPTIVKAATKGAKSAAAKGRALNKLKVTYPEAAPAVAEDLQRLSKSGGYDLTDVSPSNQGAKGAVAKAFTDIKTEIDANYQIVKDRLDPAKAIDEADFKLRTEAEKALRSGDHQVMDHATPSQIKAVEALVGNTKQGAAIIMGLKKSVEVSRLRDKVKGGVSKHTDKLNPIDPSVGKYGAIGSLGAGVGLGYTISPFVPAAQAAAVIGGRAIDAITGRRSLPKLYAKQNAPKAPMAPVGDGLPDVQVERRVAQEAEAKTQAQAKAAAEAEKIKDTEYKQQYQDAKLENTYRDAAAKKARDAQKALEKMQKPKETKAPPVIDPTQVAHVHRIMKMRKAEEARLASEIKTATKAETKAKQQKAEATGPRDAYDKPIRNVANYEAGKAKIIARQEDVRQTAMASKSPSLKSILLKAVEDLQEKRAKGPKTHKVRMEIYEEALSKAKTPHEREVIQRKLRPLAAHFREK